MAGVQGPPGVRGPPLAAPRVQDFERKVGRSLSECMSQAELDFEKISLRGHAAQVLAYILTQSDKLTNLRLCLSRIGDEGAKAIAEALTNAARKRLCSRVLDFVLLMQTEHGRVDVSKATMSDVQKLTEKNRNPVLNLGSNNIGEIGWRAIREAFASDDRLKSVTIKKWCESNW